MKNQDNFIERLSSIFSYPLREGFEIQPRVSGAKKAVVMQGRFSVPHKGHFELMKLAFKEGKKVGAEKLIIVIVMGKGSSKDKDKNPTTFEERKELIDAALDIPHEVLLAPTGFTGEIINTLRQSKYEPVLFIAGPDRIDDYKKQIEKYGDDWDIEDIGVSGVKGERLADGASATKVRDAIRKDDKKTFQKYMPKELHKYWDKLKTILTTNK
jgi:glycerol-3-phosphate cytidylyltransferase-like family protein